MTGIPRSEHRRAPLGPARSAWLNVIAAAGLSAAVLLTATASATAQDERIPAGPANMFKPGAVFTYYTGTTDPARIEGLNAALNTMTAQSDETARIISTARDGIAAGVAQETPDSLAQSVAASIEGTFAIIVQAGFVRAMAQANPAFGRMLQTAQTNINLPNGESLQLPVLLAAAVHSMSMVAAGEALRDGDAIRNLSGNYALATAGECSMPDGNITITQKDFVIEGTGSERLLLFGAVGENRIYLVSNEQRYARITEQATGSPTIDVPDTPSDLLEATLPADGEPFAFRSITRGTCAFTLTKSG